MFIINVQLLQFSLLRPHPHPLISTHLKSQAQGASEPALVTAAAGEGKVQDGRNLREGGDCSPRGEWALSLPFLQRLLPRADCALGGSGALFCSVGQ
jgi:hypothetical protein